MGDSFGLQPSSVAWSLRACFFLFYVGACSLIPLLHSINSTEFCLCALQYCTVAMSCQHNTLQFCWRNTPRILKGKYQKIYEESFPFGVFFLPLRLILMMIMTFSNCTTKGLSNFWIYIDIKWRVLSIHANLYEVLILNSNIAAKSLWWVGLRLSDFESLSRKVLPIHANPYQTR